MMIFVEYLSMVARKLRIAPGFEKIQMIKMIQMLLGTFVFGDEGFVSFPFKIPVRR